MSKRDDIYCFKYLKWKVKITSNYSDRVWVATDEDDNVKIMSKCSFNSVQAAKDDWIKYVEANRIKTYVFI